VIWEFVFFGGLAVIVAYRWFWGVWPWGLG
jgi:hypothetical protein